MILAFLLEEYPLRFYSSMEVGQGQDADFLFGTARGTRSPCPSIEFRVKGI
jgi:hypothetical protein